jgi:uncharacterized protein YjbJ (UPF0337 family)
MQMEGKAKQVQASAMPTAEKVKDAVTGALDSIKDAINKA